MQFILPLSREFNVHFGNVQKEEVKDVKPEVKVLLKEKGEYLLFIDGDCIVLPNFIGKHRHLALQGFFVPGNRVLLSQETVSC